MRILFIRHAEPNYENDTITAHGEKQAKLLSKYLKNIKIDEIYSSPLGRAQKTASYTAKNKKINPIIIDWAKETNGQYEEGKFAWSQSAVNNFNNPNVISYSNWQKHVEYGSHMFPIVKDTYKDFLVFLENFGLIKQDFIFKVDISKFSEKTIVIFCHEGFIKTLLSSVLNWPLPVLYSHVNISHASLTDIRFDNLDGYSVAKADVINLTSYLGELKTDS